MWKNYREVNTRNADYLLEYSYHLTRVKVGNLEDIDALVLELVCPYKELSYCDLYFNKMYGDLFQKNTKLNEPRPIFFVDLSLNKIFRRLGNIPVCSFYAGEVFLPYLIGTTLPFPYNVPFFLPVFSLFTALVVNEKTGNFLPYFSLSRFYTSSGYRSAASAWKIEEFIAPEIKKRIHRKPYIQIIFGKTHLDIEPYLKNEKLRKFVIKIDKEINLVHGKNQLNQFCELRHKNSPKPSSHAKKMIVEKKKEISGWEKNLYEIKLS